MQLYNYELYLSISPTYNNKPIHIFNLLKSCFIFVKRSLFIYDRIHKSTYFFILITFFIYYRNYYFIIYYPYAVVTMRCFIITFAIANLITYFQLVLSTTTNSRLHNLHLLFLFSTLLISQYLLYFSD